MSTASSSRRSIGSRVALLTCSILLSTAAATTIEAQSAVSPTDPRATLGAGWSDAKSASRNLELISHRDRPEHFVNSANHGDFGVINSDLAFKGNLVFQGNFNGFQVWDVTDPRDPKLRTSLVCTGGQGDLSVYRNLLFMSVEETRGRLDCGSQGVADTVSAERFRGVRIFDISDVAHPKQIAAVQTCRGSHTHTLVTDPKDPADIYVYVSGTSVVRPNAELAGCSSRKPEEDPNTSLFRIEVIRVPLAAPQTASIVNTPRIFADSTGAIAGLWRGGNHGAGTQSTTETNMCHDITVYPEMGLAAGACSGNGLLLDIRDPANPKRIDQVNDPNFAYWHSATFNNDASKVLFTDEWGGGTQPRCRATDRPEWGADAIFTLSGRKMRYASYYKLPVAQTATENCVAHNGSLVPVPGRDILTQAWYQGGVSVMDFTDAAHPIEIAYFDRGPMDANKLELGGQWATYWYNGHIYGSEIGRGLDVLDLKPSEYLSQNEIDAAKLVHVEAFNPQYQTKIVWPARFVVARAYVDGLERTDALRRGWATGVRRELDRAEKESGAARRTTLTQLAAQLDRDAQGADATRVKALAETVRAIR